jgi:hypothetical protein
MTCANVDEEHQDSFEFDPKAKDAANPRGKEVLKERKVLHTATLRAVPSHADNAAAWAGQIGNNGAPVANLFVQAVDKSGDGFVWDKHYYVDISDAPDDPAPKPSADVIAQHYSKDELKALLDAMK